MFKLMVDPSYSLIESKLAGFLTVAEVQDYASEAEPLIDRCAARGGYRMLIDVSGCSIQAQEVVTAFQRHVARVPQAQRLAVITGSSIVRMQVRRIISRSGIEMFSDRAAAMTWLSDAECFSPELQP